MTMMANTTSSTNVTVGFRRAISACVMAKIQAWRRYLSADRVKTELRALDGRGLADIGIASFDRDEFSIYTAGAETRDYVALTAGWPYK